MAAPRLERRSGALVSTSPSAHSPADIAAVLAQGLKLGIRLATARGLCARGVPPEVRAMVGALQQYEQHLREASDARLVGPQS